MRGLRIIGRGLRDTYDSLFGFSLATILWWLASVPVFFLWPFLSWVALIGFLLFGPGATIALFAAADPRRAVGRMSLSDMVAHFRANLAPGWKLALATLIVPAILVNNLLVFGGSGEWLALLVPLWTVLLIVSIVFALTAFAVAGMFEIPLGETLRRTAFVVVVAPFRSLFIVAAAIGLIFLGSALVVPIVLFVPALIAAILDRHVAVAFDLTIIDPNAPTDERVVERERGDDSGGLAGRLWGRKR